MARSRYALVALVLTSLLALGVASAAVSLPYEETVTVGNDTEEIETVVTNSTHELSLTVWEVDGTSETAVDSATINATSSTQSHVFSDVNASKADSYRIEVKTTDSYNQTQDGAVSVESIDVYQVKAFSGGGGGGMLAGGWIENNLEIIVGIVAILALIGAAWWAE